MFQKFRENWVRPALFFGNNPISLAGGAITAAMFLKQFADPTPWVHLDIAGTAWLEETKPYMPKVGIIFFLLLPGLFVAGLVLIPTGVVIRRKKLRKAG